MPFSDNTLDHVITGYIKNQYPIENKILDVGAGAGKWGRHLNHIYDIDAVEVFKPYIEQFSLSDIYEKILNTNVLEIESFSDYGLVILGDVLEHIEIEQAQKLVKKILKEAQGIIIIVPYMLKQGTEFGNDYETHLQPDLTQEIMLERYPELRFMGECSAANGIGWYVQE